MEIRVLRYFLEIAREGSMTAAAEVLHVSQSALSRQMKELEEELGKKLFRRGSRSVSLTDEGILLRRRAEDILDMVDKTAEECSRRAGFGYNIPDDLYDPEKNIRMGCCYLRTLMDTYGDMTLVITAYNGGTGNVRKWLGDENFADGEGGLAEIPYEETKNYVDKVLKAYDVYQKLYKQDSI